MNPPSAYNQLGKFIVTFQCAEAEIKEILVLLSLADEEMVSILANKLEYSQLLRATDVMFARFIALLRKHSLNDTDEFHNEMDEFHKLMNVLEKLGERRNELVHSKYTPWVNAEGVNGLIRVNSKLRASKGLLEKKEEELLSETFNADFGKLENVLQQLNEFRVKIIEWRYPDEQE